MTDSVFERVEELLSLRGVEFTVLRHEPVFTSQQAAEVRGVGLASGAKALICKADAEFVMFVMPADLRLDNKVVRRENNFRKLRFATAEEVTELTGLKPGSIPPFGSLFGLPTWCDSQMAAQSQINFNAGDHCISVSMRYEDYVAVESPRIATIATAGE